MSNKLTVQQLRSSSLVDGHAKLPKLENFPEGKQDKYGILAINYAKDHETISTLNNEDEIVTFNYTFNLNAFDIDENGYINITEDIFNTLISAKEITLLLLDKYLTAKVTTKGLEQSQTGDIIGVMLQTHIFDSGYAYVITCNITKIITDDGEVKFTIKNTKEETYPHFTEEQSNILNEIKETDINRLKNIQIVELNADNDNIDANTEKGWKLVGEDGVTLGDRIIINKMSELIECYLGSDKDTINKENGEVVKYDIVNNKESLNFVYKLKNETYELIKVDVSKFLVESEFGNGLIVDNKGVVNINIADGLEYIAKDGKQAIKVSDIIASNVKYDDTTVADELKNLKTKTDNIPTKTSDIINNSGYITNSAITDLATKRELSTHTDDEYIHIQEKERKTWNELLLNNVKNTSQDFILTKERFDSKGITNNSTFFNNDYEITGFESNEEITISFDYEVKNCTYFSHKVNNVGQFIDEEGNIITEFDENGYPINGVSIESKISLQLGDTYGYAAATQPHCTLVGEGIETLNQPISFQGKSCFTKILPKGQWNNNTIDENTPITKETIGLPFICLNYVGVNDDGYVKISNLMITKKDNNVDRIWKPAIYDVHSHLTNNNIHITKTDKESWDKAKSDIDAFLDVNAIKDETINTLKEIQDYISEDASAASTLVSNVTNAQNTADQSLNKINEHVDNEKVHVTTADKKYWNGVESKVNESIEETQEIISNIFYKFKESIGLDDDGNFVFNETNTSVLNSVNDLKQSIIDNEEVIVNAFNKLNNGVGLDENMNYTPSETNTFVKNDSNIKEAIDTLDKILKKYMSIYGNEVSSNFTTESKLTYISITSNTQMSSVSKPIYNEYHYIVENIGDSEYTITIPDTFKQYNVVKLCGDNIVIGPSQIAEINAMFVNNKCYIRAIV